MINLSGGGMRAAAESQGWTPAVHIATLALPIIATVAHPSDHTQPDITWRPITQLPGHGPERLGGLEGISIDRSPRAYSVDAIQRMTKKSEI